MSNNIKAKYKALNEDLQNKIDNGNLEELTSSDVRSVIAIGNTLLAEHVARTFIKNVADYFKKFGFLITREFDNVSYVIVEV